MPTTYALQDLYGGAITVELPVGLIDSSDLRQIPDHQEVFLSPTTLTSIIFEINNYVHAPDPVATSTTTTVFSDADLPADTETDAAAAAYHFTDVFVPPDRLAAPLSPAHKVTLGAATLAQFPAFVQHGSIVSYEPFRRPAPGQQQQQQITNGDGGDGTASSASTERERTSSLVHQLQLLVRLREYETDLCVRLTVPLQELAGDESEIKREEQFVADILQRIVASLNVKDFGLFGA